MATLSPTQSPKPRRKPSTRRRAPSQLAPYPNQQLTDAHNAAIVGIRNFLKNHTAYDAPPGLLPPHRPRHKAQCQKGPPVSAPQQCVCFFLVDLVLIMCRRRVGPSLEQRDLKVRRHAHGARHNPPHPVLLSHRVVR